MPVLAFHRIGDWISVSGFIFLHGFQAFCTRTSVPRLEEETHDLSSEMLPPGLFMVHDATRGCHHNVAKSKDNF